MAEGSGPPLGACHMSTMVEPPPKTQTSRIGVVVHLKIEQFWTLDQQRISHMQQLHEFRSFLTKPWKQPLAISWNISFKSPAQSFCRLADPISMYSAWLTASNGVFGSEGSIKSNPNKLLILGLACRGISVWVSVIYFEQKKTEIQQHVQHFQNHICYPSEWTNDNFTLADLFESWTPSLSPSLTISKRHFTKEWETNMFVSENVHPQSLMCD